MVRGEGLMAEIRLFLKVNEGIGVFGRSAGFEIGEDTLNSGEIDLSCGIFVAFIDFVIFPDVVCDPGIYIFVSHKPFLTVVVLIWDYFDVVDKDIVGYGVVGLKALCFTSVTLAFI